MGGIGSGPGFIPLLKDASMSECPVLKLVLNRNGSSRVGNKVVFQAVSWFGLFFLRNLGLCFSPIAEDVTLVRQRSKCLSIS